MKKQNYLLWISLIVVALIVGWVLGGMELFSKQYNMVKGTNIYGEIDVHCVEDGVNIGENTIVSSGFKDFNTCVANCYVYAENLGGTAFCNQRPS